MKIVRTYGRSVTEKNGRYERKLLKTGEDSSTSLNSLKAESNFIIAQWISTVDKTITKPKDKARPTKLQASIREKLGMKAWEHIKQKKLLGPEEDYTDEGTHYKNWRWKLHPYWAGNDKPTKENKKAILKGRWYTRFIGDIEPENLYDANLEEIVAKIHEHLHCRAYSVSPKEKTQGKRFGKIDFQLQSVKKSVFPRKNSATPQTIQDLKTQFDEYMPAKNGDFVKRIYEKANEKENDENKPRSEIKTCVFGILYAHYKTVFGDVSIEEAKEKHLDVFAVHEMVKSVYKDILQRKKFKLPQCRYELYTLILNRQRNQNTAQLIRLGKVIHYMSETEDMDQRFNDEDILNSKYWLSDGQAEIKRNEALVRVWKQAISLANHSLCLWADKDDGSDIFTGNLKPHIQATDKHLKEQAEKLFGDRKDIANPRELLEYAITAWKNLRNNSFHFKSQNEFCKAIEKTQNSDENRQDVKDFISNLWKQDNKNQAKRVKNSLKALQCHHYIEPEKLQCLYKAVQNPAEASLPLSRFNRVLENNTNNKLGMKLPEPARERNLQKNAALRCRYGILKLLYERSFPEWITDDARCEKIKGYIERAKDRSDRETRKNNKQEMIESRAAKRIASFAQYKNSRELLNRFIEETYAEKAAEFRVQHGYSHDAEQAKKSADYVEKLKMDVFAFAFDDFLKEKGWGFLGVDLEERGDEAFPSLEESQIQDKAKFWQKRLYFMLFMVPVGAVSTLRHQLEKWQVLTGKVKPKQSKGKKLVTSCRTVMRLYLDMHDARFDGGKTMSVPEQMKELFEDDKLFESEYEGSQSDSENQEFVLPLRGLREMLRFGLHDRLFPIYKRHKISRCHKDILEEMEKSSKTEQSIIDKAHSTKEKLHEKWERRKFDDDDRREYEKALDTIIKHREAAAHFRFTNHIRLYQLTMAVLARLIDYAGLWERDLYFVVRALMQQNQLAPKDCFSEGGLERLKDGRIVEALRKMKCQTIEEAMKAYFGRGYLDDLCTIRNDLSHLNMLRNKGCDLDLTCWVNKTRELMSYDRKLKNAVSLSIKELLFREGLRIEWKMEDHRLTNAEISPKQISHLGGKDKKENLHSDTYCKMAAVLMGGMFKREQKKQNHRKKCWKKADGPTKTR